MEPNCISAALGFRVHSGWTAAVAVEGSVNEPLVIERRRIITAGAVKQPYHAAEPMELPQAEAFLLKNRERSTLLATDAVRTLVSELSQRGFRVATAAVLLASGRVLPDLASILRSHALIHTAEGEFYREVMVRAATACSLPVIRIKERDIPADLITQMGALGKVLGPPWTQDEKLAALAAWKALER